MTRTAHCSCGALRVEVSADSDAVVACHCGECQRRTGSVFDAGEYLSVAIGALHGNDFPRHMRSVREESKHRWVAFTDNLVHFPKGRRASPLSSAGSASQSPRPLPANAPRRSAGALVQ